jgi:heme-degrading monooxygenase HmoA
VTFVRIWRTRLDLERLDEYERFVEQRSLPMFHEQQGFLGVICSRQDDEVAVITMWRDRAAVDALDTSASYQEAVRAIEGNGYLVGDSQVDAFEIHVGTVVEPAAWMGSAECA